MFSFCTHLQMNAIKFPNSLTNKIFFRNQIWCSLSSGCSQNAGSLGSTQNSTPPTSQALQPRSGATWTALTHGTESWGS